MKTEEADSFAISSHVELYTGVFFKRGSINGARRHFLLYQAVNVVGVGYPDS